MTHTQFTVAVLNLVAAIYRAYLVRKVMREKPWLNDGIVLPEDCKPRRFGGHRMDDWILCVKNSAPDISDTERDESYRRASQDD